MSTGRRFFEALSVGAGAVLSAALLLGMLAHATYYGGHGLAGGFEFWHLGAAAAVLALAFCCGFALAWRRRP